MDKKVIIICGTGGVGKTTLSATLAMHYARLGKKTVVITIDPAKRLAHALGLDDLPERPFNITSQILPYLSTEEKKTFGEYYAVIPRTQKAFEGLLEKFSPSEKISDKLKNNPIYKTFSKEFSGASDYVALESLDHLLQEDFEVILVDTPPSRQTLSFLKSPKSLLSFFEDHILFKLLDTKASSFLSFGFTKITTILEKLTGKGFLDSLLDFVKELLGIRTKLTLKLKKLHGVLRAPYTQFLLVSTPDPSRMDELSAFQSELQKEGYHFQGLLVNRKLDSHPKQIKECEEWAKLSSENKKAYELLLARKKQEDLFFEKLPKSLQTQVLQTFPEYTRDIHSLEELYENSKLFRSTPPFDF